jgi:hypothetical protein
MIRDTSGRSWRAVIDRIARGGCPGLGGCGRTEDGCAAQDADGGERARGGLDGWADVVRVAVPRLPDERLQLLQASRAELHERDDSGCRSVSGHPARTAGPRKIVAPNGCGVESKVTHSSRMPGT